MSAKRKKNKNLNKNKKKTKNNSLFLSIILMFLMTGSIFGYIIGYYNNSNSPTSFSYNDFQFKLDSNVWVTKVGNKVLHFHFKPEHLTNYNISRDIINELLDGNPIFVTFDPDTEYKTEEDLIRFELFNALNAVSATTKQSLQYNLPILTCDNTTGYYNDGNSTKTFERNIIYLKIGNSTKAYLSGKCVVLEAPNGNSLIALKDKLVYTLFGIVQTNK